MSKTPPAECARLSQLIADLQLTKELMGDVPIYVFDEYEVGCKDRSVHVCPVFKPSEFDGWQFPHVQLAP